MLELVSNNDAPDNLSLPAMLRRYAKAIEAGEHGDITMAVLLLENGEVIELGEEFTSFEIVGLFEAAKFNALADMACDD